MTTPRITTHVAIARPSRAPRSSAPLARLAWRFGALAAALLAVGGCLQRRVSVTSEPPGALVYLNDTEIGRTPVEADFTYYGEYDVRLVLEGYEPLITRTKADPPLYELPPFDLVATLWPGKIDTHIRWHYVLQKPLEDSQPRDDFERGLIDRAKDLQQKVGPDAAPDVPPNAAPDAPATGAPSPATPPAPPDKPAGT